MHYPKTASLMRTLTTVPRSLFAAGITLAAALPTQAAVITFDELDPGSQGYWSGDYPAEEGTVNSTFSSGTATFQNSATTGPGYTYWSGFGYSNHGDTTTSGFGNQYSSFAGGGAGGSGNFVMASGSSAVGEEGPTITFPSPTDLTGLGAWFTNATYAALSIRDGDGFSDPFGGDDGTDPDYLRLTIHGYNGATAMGTVDFYLADYRGDSSSDYIVDQWRWVNLSSLGTVDKLTFSFDSSDQSFGFINKPAYFAMDNLLSVPEPSTALAALAGLALLARRRRR
ncbi:DUF4465 domain-containing protein [Luteolibacter arcticus]|uniref:DUF4465 domain-containing protein n=1 Tax=Luteolibacter arcticus TaxID=1581411 RepID=A0ABT3GBD9_9BACT|nr:DUF4465 domain-containing protein [Luteolibacter arcticus]MCW1920941.1 DUF4465 domain-containing protein [Luteolibacter arcticus]